MHTVTWNYIAYFVAASALAWLAMNWLRGRTQAERAAYERAVPGMARVLKVGNATPSRSYGAVVVDLLIQVQRNGVEPYELSTMWSVEPGAVAKMQAGQTFAIKVDPLNRTRVYSGEAWARSLGVRKTPVE